MPTSWGGALLFLLLIAPGVLFDLLADRRRAQVKETALREAGRITLASLIFGGAAFLLVCALAAALPEVLVWPFAALEADDPVEQYGSARLAATLGAQTLMAFGAAWGSNLWLNRRRRSPLTASTWRDLLTKTWWRSGERPGRIRAVSTWKLILAENVPEGQFAHLRVRLKSGTVWLGRAGPFSTDLETSGRELVLQRPLAVGPPDAPPKPLPSAWQVVLLSGDDIDSITVQYVTYRDEGP
ncbi:hypothetical protein GC089_14745 [Cellulomonas sp. JZ18]|uniref:DUF6338 family protein n=1 Tax=Cellulomonas sp. JZ18 TaxID=2654191 RepID=UPI0012D3F533|nr:DUF6338 family protein [Cellulomonas sp. JZ18]QGQ20227.1 hypothetical protein GC089_14745 [Cellulomonas sp. JZ18]